VIAADFVLFSRRRALVGDPPPGVAAFLHRTFCRKQFATGIGLEFIPSVVLSNSREQATAAAMQSRAKIAEKVRNLNIPTALERARGFAPVPTSQNVAVSAIAT
jgi:hypothetical protein